MFLSLGQAPDAGAGSDLPATLLAKHHAREVAALAKLIRYKRLRRLRSLGPGMRGKGRIAPSEEVELENTMDKKVSNRGGGAGGEVVRPGLGGMRTRSNDEVGGMREAWGNGEGGGVRRKHPSPPGDQNTE